MSREDESRDSLNLSYRDPDTGERREIQIPGVSFGEPRRAPSLARDEDMILFAFRADPAAAAGSRKPGHLDVVLVVDGQARKATLDSEQAVALGFGLLLANPKELMSWLTTSAGSALLPEAS